MSSSRRARKIQRSLSTIDDQIAALSTVASDPDLCELAASKVSTWSIGEQVEHLRRSDLTILDALASLGEKEHTGGSPSLVARLVFLTGFIPRGRGRAPSATKPLGFTVESLAEGLADVRRRFAELDDQADDLASSRARIKHPALGAFDASQMIAFAAIHHRHHMKIIDDIRRVVGSSRDD
jgi:hypothetical protein